VTKDAPRLPLPRQFRQRFVQECDVFAADVAVSHLEVGAGGESDQNDAVTFDRKLLVSPQPGEALPGALGPVGFVVAGNRVERFLNAEQPLVNVRQLRVGAAVGEIPGHHHQVGAVRIDRLHQLRHRLVIVVARRDVKVREHGDAELPRRELKYERENRENR